MSRVTRLALAALAVAVPSGALAQFHPAPLVVPAPGLHTDVLAAPFASAEAAPAAELLLVGAGGASLRGHHALLSPLASPFAAPASFAWVRAGRLAQGGGDALPDVAWAVDVGSVAVAFGDAPGTLVPYARALASNQSPTLAPVRLHPAPRETDVVVHPWNTGTGIPGEIRSFDFSADAAAALLPGPSWTAPGTAKRAVLSDEVLTVRISATARALGIDDLYLPGVGSVVLLAHAAPPVGPALADVRLAPAVKLGGTVADGGDEATWLPPGVPLNDVLGVAALDVDFDGHLDLVVSMSPPSHYTAGDALGRLLWVKGTGDPADLATSIPWRELGGEPALQPLVDPSFARALQLDGEPALALFDRGTGDVLVVTADVAARRLRVWRASAAGRHVRDFALADVVGSPAPDLVVDGTRLDPLGAAAPPAILVYPDLGDAPPALGWAPSSPGQPLRGEDHPLAVLASDADGSFTVDWLVGDPYGAPVASAADLAPGAAHAPAYVHPGALLCGALPAELPVTVRATDALGVFTELSATLEVALAPPALVVAGAAPPGRLVLPPGGAVATLEGAAWTRCAGPFSFAWGGSLLALAAGVVEEEGATATRRILDLPEASYPALLAAEPDVTLSALDPGPPAIASPAASLAIDLDASGLVEVTHSADVAALAPGEVAVLRTALRSRLGVPLAQVRVVDALAGLVPAGPPRATGAAIVATARGGAEVVLDALPAGDAEVVIELPVRSAGERGASAVEVRSSAGHLLTPAAGPSVEATRPGCGCGGGAAGAEALLAVLALAAARRRRPLT
jgi:hypothetical protein